MTASPHAITAATIAAQAAADIKAENMWAVDVSDRLYLTDAFVVASGTSERHVNGIADAVEKALFEHGIKPVRIEGKGDGRWILIDFGEIIVHIQHIEDRAFYALDALWKDCPAIPLPADITPGNPTTLDTARNDMVPA